MIHHHPGDDLLLQMAAGRLAGGAALLLAVHLEACPHCRLRLHTMHAIGGALLEAEEPQLLAPEALGDTLARIDAPALSVPHTRRAAHRAVLPGGRAWPAAMAGCAIEPWRWMGPGMRFSRLELPQDPRASLYLLQIAPGRSLARHTHTHLELTQVLCGSFDDGHALFGPGDFDATDSHVHHQPVTQRGDVCVCLAYVEGRLEFDGFVASAIGRAIGM